MVRVRLIRGPARIFGRALQRHTATDSVGDPFRSRRGSRIGAGLLQHLVPTPAGSRRPRPFVVLIPVELAIVALDARWFVVPSDTVIESEFGCRLVRVLNVEPMIQLQRGRTGVLSPRPGSGGA